MTATDFAARYASMEDEELIALASERSSLVEEAREAMNAELQKRGITEAEIGDSEAEDPTDPGAERARTADLLRMAANDDLSPADMDDAAEELQRRGYTVDDIIRIQEEGLSPLGMFFAEMPDDELAAAGQNPHAFIEQVFSALRAELLRRNLPASAAMSAGDPSPASG